MDFNTLKDIATPIFAVAGCYWALRSKIDLLQFQVGQLADAVKELREELKFERQIRESSSKC